MVCKGHPYHKTVQACWRALVLLQTSHRSWLATTAGKHPLCGLGGFAQAGFLERLEVAARRFARQMEPRTFGHASLGAAELSEESLGTPSTTTWQGGGAKHMHTCPQASTVSTVSTASRKRRQCQSPASFVLAALRSVRAAGASAACSGRSAAAVAHPPQRQQATGCAAAPRRAVGHSGRP